MFLRRRTAHDSDYTNHAAVNPFLITFALSAQVQTVIRDTRFYDIRQGCSTFN